MSTRANEKDHAAEAAAKKVEATAKAAIEAQKTDAEVKRSNQAAEEKARSNDKAKEAEAKAKADAAKAHAEDDEKSRNEKADSAKSDASKSKDLKSDDDKAHAANNHDRKADGKDDDSERAKQTARDQDKKHADDDKHDASNGKHSPDDKTHGHASSGEDCDGDGKSEHHAHSGDDKDRDHDHGDGHTVPTPVVTPPAPPAPVESLVLHTSDVANIGTGATEIGTRQAEALTATTGHDTILGKGGNDVIRGADASHVALPITIGASLLNAASADAISFLVAGVPPGSALTAGHDNGNGTWSLTKADLTDLAISTQNAADFTLQVTASATDGSGLVDTAALHVTMHAGQGNILSGGSGNDTIYGSVNGDDDIYGGGIPTGTTHATHVPTAADNDVIFVGNGNAHVWGQAGDDLIWAGTGHDVISGGSGNDTIHASSGVVDIRGNTGNDVIFAGTGTGTLAGGAGDDVIKALGGTYLVKGGAGFDTLDFSGASAVDVDLHNHTATGAGVLTVKGIEAVVGSAFDDVIWGDKNADVFTGGGGNDTFGFHASDVKKGGIAHITDFAAGDHLDLSELLHGRAADGLVKITDGVDGETISVKVGKVFHDIAVLDHVHGLTAQDMLSHGMILT